MSLPEALERAADAIPAAADAIRDANGDPYSLLDQLGAAEATQLAAWMLTNEPGDADELLGAYAEHEKGTAAVVGVDAAALPKPGRKLLRRTLHALRSRGVEVPAAEAPQARVARLPQIEKAIEGAFTLPLDPRGSRAVLLIDPQTGNQSKVYEVVVDDLRGVVDFASYEANRSRVRAFIKQLARRTRGAAIPIEADEARSLIARAAGRQSADRPAPKAFNDHRSRLGLESATGRTPGDRARDALGDDEATRERLDRVGELVRIGRVGPWPPELEALRELAEGFKESVEGKVIVSGATQRERIESAIGDCAKQIYDEGFAAITAERFRESAFLFWQNDEADDARACLAAARRFEETPADENPVARTLTELLLGPAVSALEAPEGETPDSNEAGDADEADDAPTIVEA